MRLCDEHPNVAKWASESIKIPYRHPFTGKYTVYVPDFFVVYVDKNDGGVTVVESFETGVGCVISYGTDLQLSEEFDAPLKKDLTFKGQDVIYKK